ncbi:hypothetical protein GGTG_02040 [Gaeumannomyces tritici R3-111a-1]|uniref:Uncharacterized protein n=1 Tax=Gaeumannomyces tritici (strain R3-111a-1) TaxID=644352 RepID=J3NL94_GAET3|nr:hypothetical protein GGTG_02040 [Gaeumannomyces tritici R3-111a-1]EJT82066.1 hypothetical protein GGTG_02040 [Gaeumannomyces tritici R3-111a-1]
MISQSYLIRLLAVTAVANALPLNINLGAYSPALVVGDGAIEFKGGPGVEKIMNTLQGAGVAGAARAAAAGTGAPAREVAAAAAAPAPQGAAQASVSSGILNEQASLPIPGSSRELGPRDEPEADDDDEEVEAEATVDDEEDEADEQTDAAPAKVQKRQGGAGFDRALTYAEAALTKGPKINLGTPASGVGIIVDNNPTVAARPGTGAAEH